MIRVSNIKTPLAERGEISTAVLKKLRIPQAAIKRLHIYKESIDARHKDSIQFVYTVDVEVDNEVAVLSQAQSADVNLTPELDYEPVASGAKPLINRPVVVGSGPAGLFAGLILAEQGYKPLIIERGQDVDARAKTVEHFWATGELKIDCNVQFGEGGAGTFSDGKLTTMIRDKRCRRVLQDLVQSGAPEDILYSYKPHVGTDILREVVKGVRQRIIACGGEVRFGAKLTDIRVDRGRITGIEVNYSEILPTDVLVIALGHSARDSFDMLLARGVDIVPKPFSVGARIEHPQALIDEAQYGRFAGHKNLGAADYKLSYHSPTGRSAYTFCMCPGGQVVAAASEEGRVVTNGMSEQARNGPNANSALLVGVSPDDFGSSPLAGVEFQRRIEEHAFALTKGGFRAPAQTVGDFLAGNPSIQLGGVLPSYRPGVELTDLSLCLPKYVISTMAAALRDFDRKLRGFAYKEAVFTGVETRSSSPVRILRNDIYEANISGLYPAGEGAGYAGGIVSAAVDGIKVAEAIIQTYKRLT